MPRIGIIGGFGRSGTTGVRELLGYSPEVYSMRKEFRLFTDPDGLLSLRSALSENWTPWQADFAIYRFHELCRNLSLRYRGTYTTSNYKKEIGPHFMKAVEGFLDSLVVYRYSGLWAARAVFLKKVMLKLLGGRRNFLNSRQIFFAPQIGQELFAEKSREFMTQLFGPKLKAENKGYVLLHEPFVSQNPGLCMNVSGADKILITIRDPREIFISFLNRDWSPREINGSLVFIDKVMRRWIEEKEKLAKDSFMEVRFEDIIADVPTMAKRMADFLGIDFHPGMTKSSGYSTEKARKDRWRTYFSTKQQEQIASGLKEIIEYYGY